MTGITINKEPKVEKPEETLSEIATREIKKVSKGAKRKRVKVIKSTAKSEVKPETKLEVKPKTSREEMLRKAKILGLFEYNKSERQYEIIVSIHDYRKL